MRKYNNNTQLALDILRGKWLLHDAGKFLPAARAFINRNAALLPASAPELHKNASAVSATGTSLALDELSGINPGTEKFVAIIPLRGCLTKYDNCVGTATCEVADLIDEFLEREDVCAFVLDIDSPGGCVNAVPPVLAAIGRVRGAGKPIIAHTDQCCSAAYWIASQCDVICADNILSETGSIGAYMTVIDKSAVNPQTGEREIDIYAPQSTDKNKAYRDAIAGDTAEAERELEEIVGYFIADVMAGRPSLDDERPGVLSGAVFKTAAAIDAGLVDCQAQLSDCVEIAYVRAENNNNN